MSQGGYTHTTRATGTVLTAAIYNNDHQNHIVNQNPQMTGGYSDTLAQMQLTTDPGGAGAESLAINLAGELERIRFQLRAITGESQWYIPPSQSLGSIGGIGDGSLPITKLAPTVQGMIMGRVSAGTGPWQEFNIPALTQLSPVIGDWVLGVPAAGGAFRKIDVSNLGTGTSIEAQGRLTLQAGTPVMSTSQNNKNVVFYTPYKGLAVPLWTGTAMIAQSMGGELQQATTDNTKSPGPVAADTNYDIFFWMDGGTARATRGPSWATAISRGVGAGTTELTRIQGILVNAQAIANGPAANRGTYLGTIRTNASALVSWTYGIMAFTNQEAFHMVWNMYNRSKVSSTVVDEEQFWGYTSNTWREKHGNTHNRIYWVAGQAEDIFSVVNTQPMNSNGPQNDRPMISCGLDNADPTVTTGNNYTIANLIAASTTTNDFTATISANAWTQNLGGHFYCASERSGGGSPSFHGTRNGARAGITFEGLM